jgi:hypothetical protein
MRAALAAAVVMASALASPRESRAGGVEQASVQRPRGSPSPEPWARPWVLVRGFFDAPFGPGGGVTVFVQDRWSVNADISHRGAFGFVYGVGCHWWPRWRLGSARHQAGIGVGGEFLFTVSESAGGFAALLLLGSVDIHYLARPLEKFGFVLGGKLGLGAAFEARDFGDHPRGGSSLDHLGFAMIHYAGLSLGSRR